MKIGIDCRIYSSKFTGIGRYVFELTNRLFELDTENEFVLFFNEPEYSGFIPPNDRIKKMLVDTPIYSLKEQTRFLKILNKEQLDLMHFTHFNAPILYKGNSIVTIHDLTLSFYPGKKKKKTVHRLAYHATISTAVKKAKFIITISQNSKNDLTHLLDVDEKKIEVIYQGVGSEFRVIEDPVAITKTLLDHTINAPFILYTGVWRSHKNLPRLIEAFNELIKKPELQDYSLVITGKEDPTYPEVQEITKKLNLEEKVKFVGLVPENDLINLYNAAEVYVLPSLYEGFGLTPLEAMACGTPVACSDTSSLPEICGENNALFFNPQNVSEISETIGKIISNPILQKQLIANGLKRVHDFSWERMAQQTYNLYKKCLYQ